MKNQVTILGTIITILIGVIIYLLIQYHENDMTNVDNTYSIGAPIEHSIMESVNLEAIYVSPTQKIIWKFQNDTDTRYIVAERGSNIVIAAYHSDQIGKVIAFAVNETMVYSRILGGQIEKPSEFVKYWNSESLRIQGILYNEKNNPVIDDATDSTVVK